MSERIHTEGVQRPDAINPNTVLAEINQLDELKLPGKKHKNLLGRKMKQATVDNPLVIYVGSCPDYSHENGLYTHEGIGSGVPLLTDVHMAVDGDLLAILKRHNIPFVYKVMIADVEAIDEVFCHKFTQGDQNAFLQKCHGSMNATQNALDNFANTHGFNQNELQSTSFFEEFGYDRFMGIQQSYQVVLHETYGNDSSLRMRIAGDISARMPMYEAMYGDVLRAMGSPQEREQFLVDRTIRTMAQYLTLGRLIHETSENAVIINHPTRNIGLYNDRNKYPLNGDIQGQQMPIPVIEMTRKVY